MARVPNEPTELDPADLVDDVDERSEPKTTVKRDSKPKTRARTSTKSVIAAPPAPQVKISVPPPLPRKATEPTGFPDVDTMVAEARRRADAAGRITDRVALARARIELAVILEVLKRDVGAALAEYRAAHAIAPSVLAPIAAARRLTPLRPVPPALSMLEAELRATSDPATRAVRLVELGRLLLAGGAAPEKALQAYREVLAASPEHPGGLRGVERAMRALPRALETTTTLEALAAHLEAMIAAWGSDAMLAAWLGVERATLLERLRKPDTARAALEASLELAPGIGAVRDAYTRHLIAHDEFQRLVDAWTIEAAIEGDTPRGGRLLYATARLASERLSQVRLALELYRRATALQNTPLSTRRAALTELVRLYGATGDGA